MGAVTDGVSLMGPKDWGYALAILNARKAIVEAEYKAAMHKLNKAADHINKQWDEYNTHLGDLRDAYLQPKVTPKATTVRMRRAQYEAKLARVTSVNLHSGLKAIASDDALKTKRGGKK